MSNNKYRKGRMSGVTDSWLDGLGYYRKNVAHDETCLFRAASEQLFSTQIYHERVRKECIQHGKKYAKYYAKFFNNEVQWFQHLSDLSNHMVICGNIELEMISNVYNYDIIIFDAYTCSMIQVIERGLLETLMFCRTSEDHYDAVYKREYIAVAGFCQSLTYKILYENVFKISDVDSIVNTMLYDKPAISNDSFSLNEEQTDSRDSNSDSFIDNRLDLFKDEFITPFPFKIAKALDPNIYRNIEYDVWTEVRRELRLGDWYYGDENLILGTSCILKVDDETFHCYIQEIFKERNKCDVYITSLAERRTVDYYDLSPEEDAKPWPLPYRFSKNLTLNPAPVVALEYEPKSPRKHKDKKKYKNWNDKCVPSGSTEVKTVSVYEGCPLQMQPPFSEENSEISTTKQQDVVLNDYVEEQNMKAEEGGLSWETAQWSPLIPVTPEPIVCPQTSAIATNIFTFPTSVPSSPGIVQYLPDNGFNCFYNYPSRENQLQDFWRNINYDVSSQNTEEEAANEFALKERSQAQSSNMVYTIPPLTPQSSYMIYPVENAYNGQNHCPVPPVPNENSVFTTPVTPTSPHVEMYHHPVLQPISQPCTPVFYTPSEINDIMMTQQPSFPLFSPPLSSPSFVFPTTPLPILYPPAANSQGFIFPTPSYNTQ